MSRRTVLAKQHEDGHLELLEPVDLPAGAAFPVTLDLPEERRSTARPQALPLRRLGPMKGKLTRDEIYADLV